MAIGDVRSVSDMLAAALVVGEEVNLLNEEEGGIGVALVEGGPEAFWGTEHDIKASVIRELLLGQRVSGDADPRGIVLRGARLIGRLDLRHVTTKMPLFLQGCVIEHGIDASFAQMSSFTLEACRVAHPNLPALEAPGLRVAFDLNIFGSHFLSTDSPSVVLDRADIAGELNCAATVMSSESDASLSAELIQVGGTLHIALMKGVGRGESGTIRLRGARIGGRVLSNGSTLTNSDGPALHLDNAEVRDFISLGGGAELRGRGRSGVVRLDGAQIDALGMSEAQIVNPSGPGVILDGAVLRGDLHVDKALILGAGELGAIRMYATKIGGQFTCRGAQVVNESGPALTMDAGVVGGTIFFTEGFAAMGRDAVGGVRLPGVRAAGLYCSSGTFLNEEGTALDLYQARFENAVYLDGEFVARGGGNDPTVSLRQTHTGSIVCRVHELSHASDRSILWDLDGLTYRGLPVPQNRNWWLATLRHSTYAYAAQPYQQLATVYKAAGHDSDVREILVSQRADQLKRGALSGWRERWWIRMTGILLGYGWRPTRMLLALMAVFTISVLLAVLLGSHGALTHPLRPNQTTAEQCTTLERVGVGLELGTPIIGSITRARETCMINRDPASSTATALMVSTWVLQLLSWALAALFVAGFTGIVRKT